MITFILAVTVFEVYNVVLASRSLYHSRHHTLSGPRVFVAPITRTARCPFRLSKNAEKTKNLYLQRRNKL